MLSSHRTAWVVVLAFTLLVGAVAGLRAKPVPAGKPSADPDEELLKERGIDTDPAAVRAFLRARATLLEENRLPQFIRQLGSKQVGEREQATSELVRIGRPARALLQKAAGDPDPEVATRAAACLHQIERNGRFAVALAAVRFLLKRQPPRTVEALLHYLPFADDKDVEEEIVWGLYGLALERGELRPALREALRDKAAARRAAAACIVGRRGAEVDRTAVRKLLEDADPMVRLRAAQGLLSGGDKAGLPALIALLSEPALALCWQAEELLHWAAGETAPKVVVGAATAAERKACREAWQEWARAHADKVDLKQRLGDVRRPGLMLVCSAGPKGYSDGAGEKVWLRGCDGRPRWQMAGGFWDAHLLTGNRLLLAEAREGPKGESLAGMVTEREPGGKVLWETKGLGYGMLCRRLANGNTFITEYRGATGAAGWEVGTDGKPVCPVLALSWEGKEANNKPLVGVLQRLGNGRIGGVVRGEAFLVEVAGITNDGCSADGDLMETQRVLRKVAIDPRVVAQVLPLDVQPNGHWLANTTPMDVRRGEDVRYVGTGNELLELDTAGKVVWRYRPREPWWWAARLRDGHAVLACGSKHDFLLGGLGDPLIEVDAAGRKVWEDFPGSLTRRVRVCLSLVRLGFDQPPAALVDFDSAEYRARELKDKDPQIRLRAVLLLGDLGPKAEPAIPGLIEALAEPDYWIRENAEQALLKVGAGAAAALVRALDDKRSTVRTHALIVLGALKYRGEVREDAKAVATKVLAALRDEDPLVRRRAASAAGRFADVSDEMVPALVRAMKDKAVATTPRDGKSKVSVAADAIWALGMIGGRAKDAIPALFEVAQGEDEDLRFRAVSSLGTIGRDKAMAPVILPLLLKILTDKDQIDLHPNVVSALYQMGPQAEPAVPALRDALKLRDVNDAAKANPIRIAVLNTLARLGPAARDAVPDLIALLQDKKLSTDDRQRAVDALAKIGSAAKAALPALTEIAEDQREAFSLRSKAAYAVKEINR